MKDKTLKLVIASGKGGVGKSMLASSLAILFSKKHNIVAVDCDVDAPNLAIWLNEDKDWEKIKKISVSEKPMIDNQKCPNDKGKECVKKCKFGALYIENNELKVNPFLCEGCGACEIFCPKGVIRMKPVKNGEIREKITKYGFPLIAGQLFPGETGSGKIVTEIKEQASATASIFFSAKAAKNKLANNEKSNYELMLIDAAPGTGCPLNAVLRDANFAVLVCEPTLSGFSDLKRVLGVVNYFKIPYGVVINKWEINPETAREIKKWARRFLGKISYDEKIFKAISNLSPVMETQLKAKKEIREIYQKLTKDYLPI